MSKVTVSPEALHRMRVLERRRHGRELQRARQMDPNAADRAHESVSSQSPSNQQSVFAPAFGSLGKTDSAASANIREVMMPVPSDESQRMSNFVPSGPEVDAYWASYGTEEERELATDPAIADSNTASRVVIGEDDRVEVTNNELYPWRCICSLKMISPNGTNLIGTGWLVSPRVLLTAGHCVYSQKSRYGIGWMSQIEVIPGRRGSSYPFGSVNALTWRTVRGWTEDVDRDYDYGAIILPESQRYGDQLGWLGYAVRDDDELDDLTVNLSGYPVDKPSGTQWFHSRDVDDVDDRSFNYKIDTAGGQSGSPVWQMTHEGYRYGVGIHTNGSLSGNSATRITDGVFNNIISWIGIAP